MDEQLKNSLFHMYQNYKRELWEYTGENCEEYLRSWFEDMFIQPSFSVHPVRNAHTKSVIGFYIIQKLDDEQRYESDCEWYISEAYIMPSYRKQGFMTGCMYDFVMHHEGNIGLVVIDNNTKALKFWKSTMKNHGYTCERVPELSSDIESFYRFSKK